MSRKTREVLLRSDRVLVGALAVILSVASAALGAAAADRPRTDEVVLRSSVALESDAPQAVVAPAVLAPKAAAVAVAPAQATAAVAPAVATATVATTTAPPAAASTPADVALAQLLAEHRCLAEVLYYEARGEGTAGQMAVAEVIFHRLRHGQYGHSICAVVYEGAGTHSCQFSFACHGQLAQRKAPGAWHSAEMLAARILTGETQLRDTTGDATHFHAASVSPDWAEDMVRTVQIGNHVFYKRGRSRAL
jgi:spore germination cell wall hydrolase CwlJ-like protein